MENTKRVKWFLCDDADRIENQDVSLDSCDVHIWRIWLDNPYIPVEQFWQVIDSEERSKAERFRFQRDRTRYVVCHAMLRTVLSCYVGINPADLKFLNGVFGKPHLVDSQKRNVEFNISHSDALALIAVTRGHRIGVDVEYIKPIPEMDHIFNTHFSERERAMVNNISPDQRDAAFFACWTLKEAFVKATEYGLSQPVDQFDRFSFFIRPSDLMGNEQFGGEESGWLYKTLAPDINYKGAVVVEE